MGLRLTNTTSWKMDLSMAQEIHELHCSMTITTPIKFKIYSIIILKIFPSSSMTVTLNIIAYEAFLFGLSFILLFDKIKAIRAFPSIPNKSMEILIYLVTIDGEGKKKRINVLYKYCTFDKYYNIFILCVGDQLWV